MNTCQLTYQERDKMLRNQSLGSRYRQYMTFLNEMFVQVSYQSAKIVIIVISKDIQRPPLHYSSGNNTLFSDFSTLNWDIRCWQEGFKDYLLFHQLYWAHSVSSDTEMTHVCLMLANELTK